MDGPNIKTEHSYFRHISKTPSARGHPPPSPPHTPPGAEIFQTKIKICNYGRPQYKKTEQSYFRRIYKKHFLKRPENARFSELPSTLEKFFQKRPFWGVKFSKNARIWQVFF